MSNLNNLAKAMSPALKVLAMGLLAQASPQVGAVINSLSEARKELYKLASLTKKTPEEVEEYLYQLRQVKLPKLDGTTDFINDWRDIATEASQFTAVAGAVKAYYLRSGMLPTPKK